MQPQRPVAIDRTGHDIHDEAARIRAAGTVARIVLPGEVEAWSIAGHDAAQRALTDPRFSKDARQHWIAFANGEIGPDFPLLSWALMDNVAGSYGEQHTRLRKLILKAFTARRVEGMRPIVERIVGTLLDNLAAEPPGSAVDLKARFAQPLTTLVICELCGVPDDFRDEMLTGGVVNVTTTITPEEAAANVARWRQAMHGFVEAKRRRPGDDLTADLIAAQEADGSRLTDAEIVGTLHFLRAAGTVPTMNLIANTVFALLTHPDQLRLVESGRVGWDEVIEESLRVQAPVAHLPFRFPVEDVEIDGVCIPKGEPVLVNYAAIGRDPDVHGDSAGQFDITRAGKQHLAFGYGIYRCIGVPLARVEASVALSMLYQRFPGLSLAVDPREVAPEPSFIMNGRQTVPVYLH